MTVIYTGRSENPPKARPSLLPLLVVLFIASYTILTMLVVEQGRTIDAQRGLLREMLKDSTQLADLKSKLARESEQPEAKIPAAPRKDEGAQAKSSAAPSSKSSEHSEPRVKTPHTMREVPTTPAEDLQDVRRSKVVI